MQNLRTYGSRIKLKIQNSESKLPLMKILSEKQNKDGPSVWITKWVDYSAKYGLGYSLSNQTTGVYFNDNTKLIQDLS